MWAGIAAVRIGARRLAGARRQVRRWRRSVAAMAQFMDYGEQVSLRALAGAAEGRRSRWRRSRTAARSTASRSRSPTTEFIVDLRDNPDQDAGPNNSRRDGAMVAAQMVFKIAHRPVRGRPTAAPSGRCELLTRPGSVFDAQEPAAFAVYYEVEVRLYDLIWRCLAPAPRRPAAGRALRRRSAARSSAARTRTRAGTSRSSSRRSAAGAARPRRDGNSAIFSGFHGETYNCPAEVAEARYGLYVDRMELNDAPGGEGEHRGGKGIVVDYRVRSRRVLLHLLLHAQQAPAVGRSTAASRARPNVRGGHPRRRHASRRTRS